MVTNHSGDFLDYLPQFNRKLLTKNVYDPKNLLTYACDATASLLTKTSSLIQNQICNA